MKLLDSSIVTSFLVLLKYKTHELNVREQNWEIHGVTEKQSLALFSTSLPLLLLHYPLASFELAKNLYVLLWPAEYGLYNPSQGPTPLAVLQQQ